MDDLLQNGSQTVLGISLHFETCQMTGDVGNMPLFRDDTHQSLEPAGDRGWALGQFVDAVDRVSDVDEVCKTTARDQK